MNGGGGRRREERAFEIAGRAIELEPTRRLAFVRRLCDGDVELESRVVSVLEDVEGSEIPIGSLRGPLRLEDTGESRRRDAVRESVLSQLSEFPATFKYELGPEVGRGGMGEVVAARDRVLDRSLALKRLRDPAPAAEVPADALARFVEEARITARLQHPGIVPVHEVGLDEEGRAFIAMKLVDGASLERAFQLAAREEEGWTQTRAVGVLLRVCEAMSYAHDRGVIHRDLKPANVMVGDFDEVQVMDWGLARSLEAPQEPGEAAGTPSYMPPEQAGGRRSDVGPRSDVYAVGAMLYRLLVGRAPYLGIDESPAPAVLLDRLSEGPPEELRILAPRAPAELAAICEKAMARSADDRYGSMADFKEDLRAYLETRVVRAYHVGALPELVQWVRRNRGLAASLAAILVLLVAGLSIVLHLNRRLTYANVEAERERGISEQLATFTGNLFKGANPLSPRASADRTLPQILDIGARTAPILLADQPVARDRFAGMIGQAYAGLGRYDLAEEHLTRSLDGLRVSRGEDHPDTQAIRLSLADLQADRGAYAEAEGGYLRSIEELTAIAGERDRRTLTARNNYGSLLSNLGRHGEAVAQLERVLEIRLEEADASEWDVLSTMTNLASAVEGLGELERARELYEEARARLASVHGEDHVAYLTIQNNLAHNCLARRDLPRAEALFREVLDARRVALGPGHPDTLLSAHALASFLRRTNGRPEAEEVAREALEVCSGISGGAGEVEGFLRFEVAEICLNSQRREEAAEHARVALEIVAEFRGETRIEVLEVRRVLGEAIKRSAGPAGWPEAEQHLTFCVEQFEAQLGTASLNTLEALLPLIDLYRVDERPDRARALLPKVREALLGPEAVGRARHLHEGAGLHFALGEFDPSAELYERAFRANVERAERGPNTLQCARGAAIALYRADRRDEAAAFLRAALDEPGAFAEADVPGLEALLEQIEE